MARLEAVTKEGADRVVGEAALGAFEAGFRGTLLRPGRPMPSPAAPPSRPAHRTAL